MKMLTWTRSLFVTVILASATVRAQYGSDKGEYPKNRNPFGAWNDPMKKNDPFAPHNDPIGKTNPFKPWNSPVGNNDDLSSKERKAYGLPSKSSSAFSTDKTDSPRNKSPTAPWNSPVYKDSPLAPHNSPVHKTDPTKPWNSPAGNNNDLTPKERKAYGLPPRGA